MQPRLAFAALTTAAALASSLCADVVDLPRHPSISPDGSEVVFSWRGDLWRVSSNGGLAVRLTSHPQDDLASAWSQDGRSIAFESERDGFRNLFTMRREGTELTQITHFDRDAALAGWGRDPSGRADLLFTAGLEHDLFRSSRPYRIALEGGQPTRLHGAFGTAPQISPDGTRVLFERGGSSWSRRHYRGPDQRDVWLLDTRDGSFRKLTSWEGNDGQPRWVGNERVFFLSDRANDTVNLYSMGVERGDAGPIETLTSFRDTDVVGFDASADGEMVVLHVWDALWLGDLRRDALKSPSLRPIAITAAADAADNIELREVGRNVTDAALNPDGKTMATIAYGDVYVCSLDEKTPARAVTSGVSREKEIAWSPDGLTLYFVSDESGVEVIRAATVVATRSELRDAAKAADRASGAAPVPTPAPAPEHEEGKSEPPAGDAPPAPPEDPASDKSKPPTSDRWQDAVRFAVITIAEGPANLRSPSPSPDGKQLAYRRGAGTLLVRELSSGQDRVLVDSWDPAFEWSWSPDSRFISYAHSDRNFNSDIFIAPIDGSAPPVNITRHPDNETRPRWSADGKVLTFLSQRIDNHADVWMVYLDKSIEAMTPFELERYYKDAAEAAKKRKHLGAAKNDGKRGSKRGDGETKGAEDPSSSDDKADAKSDETPDDKSADKPETKDDSPPAPPKPLDLEDAYLRLKRITSIPGDEGNLEITPAGDRFIFSAAEEGVGLFSLKWDGTDRKKLGPMGRVQHLTLTGDRIIYVATGRAASIKPEGGDQKFHDIDATITIDRGELSARKFVELARTLGEQFYHPSMKGLDWPALTQRYLALARAARTADEFNSVASRFVGELNASHLGVSAPEASAPIRQTQGRIGVTWTRTPEGVRIDSVLPESPATRTVPPLRPDDLIVAVEFIPLDEPTTLEVALRGRVGKETALTVRRGVNGATSEFSVLLTPISFDAQRRLAYDDWQARTRALVVERSGGRAGYIHIESMSQPQLDEFERDLFAAADGKKGLIIDVRNNGGGWTADRLLTSITAQPHSYTLPRGMSESMRDGYPQDRLFIQGYSQPMNLLCNEKSFSNAEIIAHAFKTLKRGTLVGQQTYGGVISTGAFSLLDGTSVRLPFRGWYLSDGTDMENHGAMPDLVVAQTPEAESANRDEQLEAAVDDLVKRLK